MSIRLRYLLVLFFSLLCTVSFGHPKRHHPYPHHKLINSHKQALEAIRRKHELAHKLNSLHDRLYAIREHINTVHKKEHKLNVQIMGEGVKVKKAQSKLMEVGDRMLHLQAVHLKTQTRLFQTEQKLRARRKLLAERVQDEYTHGGGSYATVLLSATSLQDLLTRKVYVNQILKSDEALISGVQNDIHKITLYRAHLDAQERQQNALATVFESRKQVYLNTLYNQQSAFEHAEKERKKAETYMDVMENQVEEMSDTIQTLSSELEERQAQQEAKWEAEWRREHPHATAREVKKAVTHYRASNFERSYIWKGKLIRPVHGPITSPFGMRYHPILHRWLMHTGVDFGVPEGTPIHAAGSGTVILSHYVSGYGYCVVIDHGGGISTLYGHCSRLLCHAGEVVKQGQVIALVGATGLATGPNLHFEVRVNGRPVKPF